MVQQLLAIVIFLIMFLLIVTEKVPRHIATLSCGALMVVVVFGFCMRSPAAIAEALSLHSLISPGFWYQEGAHTVSTGINWETITFIFGMMIMVEGMAESDFFRWLCISLARLMRFNLPAIFISFMLLSALLSMFIDSITVVLFLSAVTMELAAALYFDPIPLILTEIFCANLGGSATMCGDPPNIIIGTSLGYTFSDFIANTGIMALLCILLIVPWFCFVFRRKVLMVPVSLTANTLPKPHETLSSRRSFIFSCIIFLSAIVLLVTHAKTGLTVSCIGVIIAAVTLLHLGKKSKEVLRRLDYQTLLFFIGLFIVVSGLEQTGTLALLADGIGRISSGNSMLMVGIIMIGSALASAFIDNIPFAATMIPVIKSLALLHGADLDTLAWALSMGTDLGGNATPIGASANIVGISVAAKGNYHIGWKTYCLVMAPATVIVIFISMTYMLLHYF